MSKREKSLELYYENPSLCLNCGKIIEVKEGRSVSETKRKKFCNSSCAASFNNKGIVKNPNGNNGVPFNKSSKICPTCGGIKSAKGKQCVNCSNINRDIGNRTLGSYIDGEKYLTSKCQEIRRHARKIIENSNNEKICKFCNNSEFSEIYEVHHIKGILEFSKESTLYEINDINNLM